MFTSIFSHRRNISSTFAGQPQSEQCLLRAPTTNLSFSRSMDVRIRNSFDAGSRLRTNSTSSFLSMVSDAMEFPGQGNVTEILLSRIVFPHTRCSPRRFRRCPHRFSSPRPSTMVARRIRSRLWRRIMKLSSTTGKIGKYASQCSICDPITHLSLVASSWKHNCSLTTIEPP